jgi:N-acetylneuraminic acid mutarotase
MKINRTINHLTFVKNLPLHKHFNALIYIIFVTTIFSCEKWTLDEKDFPDCTAPSATIKNVSDDKLNVKLSLDNVQGVIEKAVWNINNGLVTITGNSVAYSFSNQGTYPVSVEISNKCGDTYVAKTQITVSNLTSITLEPTIVSTNSAILQMSVSGIANSSIIKYGICYSDISPTPILENSKSIFVSELPVINQVYSFKALDIKDNTKYYYRAFVSFSGGTVYGEIKTLNTLVYTQGLTSRTVPPITGREGAISFIINEKVYFGLGRDGTGSLLSDLYEYNTVTDVWTKKSNLPSGGLTRASVFVIDNVAYIGLGFKGGGSTTANGLPTYNETSEFWKYEPANDKWTSITRFPGIERASAFALTLNKKGYVFGGGNSKNNGIVRFTYFKDTWEFDPLKSTWIQKSNFNGGERSEIYGINISDKAYLGYGQALDSQTGASTGLSKAVSDMWEFDPVRNTWFQQPATSLGNISFAKIGFSIQNKGYFGIFNSNNQLQIFTFEPVKGFTSVALTSSIVTDRNNAISTYTNNSGFFGLGSKSGFLYNDFYRFNP